MALQDRPEEEPETGDSGLQEDDAPGLLGGAAGICIVSLLGGSPPFFRYFVG